jgi:hypothetical protein
MRLPPRSSALPKPRLCRPGAPPHRTSLTPLPPDHLGFRPPFRRKTLFAFRVRRIDYKTTTLKTRLVSISTRRARPGIAAQSTSFPSLCTPQWLGCIIPRTSARPPRLASAVCIAGSSASGNARASSPPVKTSSFPRLSSMWKASVSASFKPN